MKAWPLAVAALLLAIGADAVADSHLLDFSPAERAAIVAHGPWPPAPVADPSHRAFADPAAAALGQRLFFDLSLSASGRVSCASCHLPGQAFQDGRAVAQGQGQGARNTPSLLDVAGQRWFGWGGSADSLWAASLRAFT